jgi:SpoVK/Ycf46/Vps4 family AAA+-type ATPase
MASTSKSRLARIASIGGRVGLAGRAGRFDQVVWMGLPDERGRADIFEHYLRGLKLDPAPECGS